MHGKAGDEARFAVGWSPALVDAVNHRTRQVYPLTFGSFQQSLPLVLLRLSWQGAELTGASKMRRSVFLCELERWTRCRVIITSWCD